MWKGEKSIFFDEKLTRTGDTDCGGSSTDEHGSWIDITCGWWRLERADLWQKCDGCCVLGNHCLALWHDDTAQRSEPLASIGDLKKRAAGDSCVKGYVGKHLRNRTKNFFFFSHKDFSDKSSREFIFVFDYVTSKSCCKLSESDRRTFEGVNYVMSTYDTWSDTGSWCYEHFENS